MALTWWDKNEKELNFARNKERPLHYVITPDQKTLIWASEEWFIWISTSKNGIKLNDNSIQEVEEDTHYKFKLVEGKVEVNKIKLSPFKRPPIVIQTGGNKPTKDTVGVNAASKYHTDEFLIETWNPTAFETKNGKREEATGYFEGSNFQYERVRVVVNNITEEIREIIKDLEEENMWSTWKTTKMQWHQFKKSKEWFHFCHWHDVVMIWDYKANSSPNNNVITLHPPKKTEVVLPDYAPFMGMMIPKAQWETNLQKTKGCAQCGNDVTWEDRKKMRWWYHGSEIVFDCPTCAGTYN
jgi:hypothetical protein